MTHDPDQPFKPPNEDPDEPDGSAVGSGATAVLGVVLGLSLGILGPPLVWGLFAAVLNSGGVQGVVQILVPLGLAVAGVPAAYLAILRRLDINTPRQAAMRSAMVVTGYISLGFWAVVLVLFGLCIALLAGAY